MQIAHTPSENETNPGIEKHSSVHVDTNSHLRMEKTFPVPGIVWPAAAAAASHDGTPDQCECESTGGGERADTLLYADLEHVPCLLTSGL